MTTKRQRSNVGVTQLGMLRLMSLPNKQGAKVGTTTVALASDAQRALIRKLLAERNAADVAHVRNLLNAQPPSKLPKAVAKQAIDALLLIPSKGIDMEEGYYVHGDDVYLVVKSKQTNRKYAKRLIVPNNRDPQRGPSHERARWDYERGAIYTLKGLKPLTIEEAARLGHLHGYCVVCGRRLDDPESVQRGIGPVCVKRLPSSNKAAKAKASEPFEVVGAVTYDPKTDKVSQVETPAPKPKRKVRRGINPDL